jgi:hypothetical protein
MKAIPVVLVLLAGAMGASCVVDRRPVPASASNEQVAALTTEQATDMLSEAQCDYYAKCSRVGPTATYASPDHCLDMHREGSAKKFADCRHGIDGRDLRACTEVIRGQDCGGLGTLIDTVERSAACRSGELCLD